MGIRWARSARRRRVSHDRSEHVVKTTPNIFRPPGPPERPIADDCVLFVGFDSRGVPLEVVAVELTGGDLLVIHAMKMHPEYGRYWEKGKDAKASDIRTRRRRRGRQRRRGR